MKHSFLFYFFVVLYLVMSREAEAGTNLNIYNFKRKEVGAGSQSWMIKQSPRGYTYIANKKGLLQFDGAHWTLYPTLLGGEVRSLLVSEKNKRVYVGGTNEIGYFSVNKAQAVVYTSLLDSDKHDYNFGCIWNIAETEHQIIFLSSAEKFTYNKDSQKLTSIKFPFIINSSLYYKESFYLGTSKGLFVLSGNNYFEPRGAELLKGMKIRSIISLNQQQLLIGTATHGIFLLDEKGPVPYKTPYDSLLFKNEIFCMAHNSKYIAIGTVRGGLVVFDLKGKLIHHFDEESGLQNNTVLSCEFDKNNNLWLGLDNGIDYLMLNSPVSDLDPTFKFIGAGYDAKLFENKLYLATNRGLYSISLPLTFRNKITSLDEITGQVWSMKILNNRLLVASDKGVSEVYKNRIRNTEVKTGVWRFAAVKEDSNIMIAKGYNNIYVFHYDKKGWTLRNAIPHPLLDHFNLQQDSTHRFINTLSKEKSEQWLFNSDYTNIIKQTEIHKINATPTWGSLNRHVLQKSGIDLIEGFENTCAVDSFQDIICHENGFALYDSRIKDDSFPNYPRAIISDVSSVTHPNICLYNSSILNEAHDTTTLPYPQNSLLFTYESLVQLFEKTKFQYRLDGYETEWSAPTSSTTKEYNNLMEGTYTFQVRCCEDDGDSASTSGLLAESQFHFTILPPWYRSYWSYTVYFLFIIGICIMLYHFDTKRMNDKKKRLEILNRKQIKQLEIEHEKHTYEKEQEIQRLKTEHLELTIKQKGQEVATLALNFLRKNEMLTRIKDEIHASLTCIASNKVKDATTNLRNISLLINSNISNDSFLKQFEENFDLLNNNFIEKLTNTYPSLSITERKLCAFLIMGLSTKEISSLLDLSTRGVETIRYRLRKKFNLGRSASLTDFLNELKRK